MEFKNLSYLLIVLVTIGFTAAFSFGKNVRFYSKLKYLLPAFIFTGTIFIIWNIRFVELSIWNFNPEFITGKQLFKLPLEEVLFLFAITYFSVLIYETVKVKFFNFWKPNVFLILSLFLLIIFGFLAFFSRDKLYTFFTFFLLSIYFAYTIFRNRFKVHFSRFYLTYIFAVIPFISLKLILIYLPALSYDIAHILGIRILNVPVEDFGYFFLLLLMNVTIYEYLTERQFY